MRKKCLPLALASNGVGLALLFAALFFVTPNASAFDLAGDCAVCHSFPVGGGTHSRHTFTCTTCHASGIGDNPDTAVCGTCHANPGLVDRHVNRGEACLACHGPDPRDIDDDGDAITENGGDCNDADASIFPGAEDICGDGIDQDCNGADLVCPPADNDNDGSTANLDCNDNDASIFPGASEICGDGVDQDCSGADLVCPPADNDNDGSTANLDCNDNDASIFPGATEICGDGIDQDCSGADRVCTPVDSDNDGSTADLDCNDADASIFPGAVEVCNNGVDENCNPNDDICAPAEDADNDGYSVLQGDCNDTDDTLHPGAVEVCGNGIDENCNPNDDVCADVDDDGFSEADGDCNDMNASIHPDAIEIVGNGIDENCNGPADDREPTTDACTDWRFQVKRAVYNQAKQELSISGKVGDSTEIVVSDGDNGVILASAGVEAPSWKLKITDLPDAPETILVASEAGCLDEVEVRVRKRKAVKDEDHDDAEQPEAPSVPHVFGWDNPKQQHGDVVEEAGVGECLGCHSVDRAEKGQAMSCYRCHGREWEVEGDGESDHGSDDESVDQPGEEIPAPHTFGWTNPAEQHRDQVEALGVEACAVCHSTQEADQGQPLSCFNCHGNEWTESESDEATEPGEEPAPVEEPAEHPFGWDNPRKAHDDYVERNSVGECLGCHSTEREERATPMSCYKCHGKEW